MSAVERAGLAMDYFTVCIDSVSVGNRLRIRANGSVTCKGGTPFRPGSDELKMKMIPRRSNNSKPAFTLESKRSALMLNALTSGQIFAVKKNKDFEDETYSVVEQVRMISFTAKGICLTLTFWFQVQRHLHNSQIL